MIDESEGDAAHKRRLRQHLDAMLALCETVECRRVQLLNYFGQKAGPCGNCDTCLSPPESWDGTVGRAEGALRGVPAEEGAQPELRRRAHRRHPARQAHRPRSSSSATTS
jgi:superfamily II DNA helicase RecQ